MIDIVFLSVLKFPELDFVFFFNLSHISCCFKLVLDKLYMPYILKHPLVKVNQEQTVLTRKHNYLFDKLRDSVQTDTT